MHDTKSPGREINNNYISRIEIKQDKWGLSHHGARVDTSVYNQSPLLLYKMHNTHQKTFN